MHTLIIGLAGQPSSGKDTAAEFLASKGFTHISTSDMLRARMRENNIPIDRVHMHDFSASERAIYGPGYLAVLAAEKAKDVQVKGAIISGLRHPAEVEALRSAFGAQCILVVTEASIETRYKRAKDRNRTGDDISFERFKEQEEAERKSASGAHEVDAVIAMADEVVHNDGTREEFMAALESLYNRIST